MEKYGDQCHVARTQQEMENVTKYHALSSPPCPGLCGMSQVPFQGHTDLKCQCCTDLAPDSTSQGR